MKVNKKFKNKEKYVKKYLRTVHLVSKITSVLNAKKIPHLTILLKIVNVILDTNTTKREKFVKVNINITKKLLAIMQIMNYAKFVMIKRIVKSAERMPYLIKINVFAKKVFIRIRINATQKSVLKISNLVRNVKKKNV